MSGRVGLNFTKRGREGFKELPLSQLVLGRFDGLVGLPRMCGRKVRCKSPAAVHSSGSSKFKLAAKFNRRAPRLVEAVAVIRFSE